MTSATFTQRRRGMRSSAGRKHLGGAAAASLTTGPGRFVVYGLVLLWTLPTFGVFISSFRSEVDVKTSGWWQFFTSPRITLENYERVLSSSAGDDNLGKFLINSVEITAPAVFFSVAVGLLAAYAFSWMKFRGREWLFVGFVALLVLPLQMALIPLLQLFVGGAHIGSVTIFPDLNLTGNVYGLWFAHLVFGLPFVTYILKNFVQSLPRDILEAARVDGAGHWTIFLRLIIPLSMPAIASISIFQTMWIWNDYLIALIYAGRENAPVTAQLAALTGTRGADYHLLTAAGMLAMLVPLGVFFGLQRYFVRGLLAGAVKG